MSHYFLQENKLSFSNIANLFQYLVDLTLNDLEISGFAVYIESYHQD